MPALAKPVLLLLDQLLEARTLFGCQNAADLCIEASFVLS
jgi:hypothetical protein